MAYFSIVMSTYNRAGIISEAIQSLIDQTFKDFELIIVDDHGTDNTSKVIDDFRDKRFRYFYLDNNRGPSGARNYAINMAKAKIIIIADSDDINYPQRLELTHREFIKQPDLEVVYGLAIRKEMDNSEFLRPSSEFNAQLLKYYNYIANSTTAFKKDLYEKIGGYDELLRTSEDYDYWLSCLEKNAKFKYIDKPLIMQKIHEGSTLLGVDIEKRRANLTYVRKKHNIEKPSFEKVKKLVSDKELLDFISTPSAIDFWFK